MICNNNLNVIKYSNF
uniref:Uncharacterized protein n=1 Tax=Moumouvirus sp. 'Monve' TaxID=1128131 RepID=H2EF91_9VIRU|nr:hypothetical protein mv_L954 [Moumouvirus Monve]